MKRKMIVGILATMGLGLVSPMESHAFLGGIFSAVDAAADRVWKAFMKQNAIKQLAKMTTNAATAKKHYDMAQGMMEGEGLGANLVASLQYQAEGLLANRKYVFTRDFFDGGNPNALLNKVGPWAEGKIEKTFLSITHIQKLAAEDTKTAQDIQKKAPNLNPQAVGRAQLATSAKLLEQTARMNIQLAQLLEMETYRFRMEQAGENERELARGAWQASLGKTKGAGPFAPRASLR